MMESGLKSQTEFNYAVPDVVTNEEFSDLSQTEHTPHSSPTLIGRIDEKGLSLVSPESHDSSPSPDSLHQAILPASFFPETIPVKGVGIIPVEIISNHSLRIRGENIKLKRRQVFFFNALMLLRDEPRSAKDYVDLGFTGSRGVKDLSSAAGPCIERINEAAGTDVIRYYDGNNGTRFKTYEVNPAVQILDSRDATEDKPAKQKRIYKTSSGKNIPLLPSYPYEHVEFSSLLERSSVMNGIVAEYRDHPRINELLGYVLSPVEQQGEETVTYPPTSPEYYRLLDHDETVELFKAIERGLSARVKPILQSSEGVKSLAELTAAYHVVYSCNLRLVKNVALKVLPNSRDPFFEDLYQEGLLGLGKAIRRFDYRKGYRFSTYAHDWITQSIYAGYDEHARTIRIPRENASDWINFKKSVTLLREQMQREPTTQEIIDETGFSASDIVDLRSWGPRTLKSLNEPRGYDDDEVEFGETIVQDTGPESTTYRPALHPEIEDIFNAVNLSERAQLVLSLRYGVYLDLLVGKVFSYNGAEILYEDLIEALHTEGGELSTADVAALLGMKEESAGDRIRKSLNKIHDSGALEGMSFVKISVRE